MHRSPEWQHAIGAAQGSTFLFSDIPELRLKKLSVVLPIILLLPFISFL
jgi:hypothetical protein